MTYQSHRDDPGGWAKELNISKEAVELYLSSDVIDMHVDSFIWTRVFGYDLTKRHGHGLLGARFYSQVDIPRIREAAVTGAIWVISTNPTRSSHSRPETFVRNLNRLQSILASVPQEVAFVKNAAEYQRVKSEGKHAAFIGIQGGNALDDSLDSLDLIPDQTVLRITLVHLSNSRIGQTSSPAGGTDDMGLTNFGRDYVKKLNSKKIFVDLAHISRRGFFDVAAVHDKSQPLIVTHTGVCGVWKHWRNLDDEQLRVIADTGGTVGVMYQSSFLGPSLNGKASWIVDHLEHICKTVGDDYASLGSDWDGAIWPPRDMLTCLELPKIVQIMLDRGFSSERIQKILGKNFLRVVASLRG